MRGSIGQRSKGSWEICVDIGRNPPTGRLARHFESVKGRKADAQKRLSELLVSVEQGSYIKPNRLIVAQFLEERLRDYAGTNTAPRTAERCEEIVRVHLIPALGSLPITALRPDHIQRYYTQALESGRRDGKGGLPALTVHHHHRLVYEALKYGVRHGVLGRNVAEAVDPPRSKGKELVILGPKEVQLILDGAKGTLYYPLFFTIAYTGLRRSELLGLQWSDLDLAKSTLSVVRSLHQLHGGKYILGQPKNKRGRRQVALSPSLVIELWQHQLKQENAQKSTLKGVRLHDLRHAHATILLEQGVHPKIVQERLGHSSVSTTLDIYSHVVPGLQEAARKFEEGLQSISAEVSMSRVIQESVGKMLAKLHRDIVLS